MTNQKKNNRDPFNQDYYEWICISKEDDIKDGIYRDNNERVKFEDELGLKDINIVDELESLRESNLYLNEINRKLEAIITKKPTFSKKLSLLFSDK